MFPVWRPSSLEFYSSSNIRVIPLIPSTNSCNCLTSRGNLHSNAGCSFPWPPQLPWYQTVGHKDVLWLLFVQIHYCQHNRKLVWGWCHKRIKIVNLMVKGKVKERRKPSRGGQDCVNVSSAFFFLTSWLQGKWDVLPCVNQDLIKYGLYGSVLQFHLLTQTDRCQL